MAEAEETSEQKIARLEAELEKAKRILKASQLAVMTIHEYKKRLIAVNNLIWMAKKQGDEAGLDTSHLAAAEGFLEGFDRQAENALAAYRAELKASRT